jgi:UDP-galactopyranose mutase
MAIVIPQRADYSRDLVHKDKFKNYFHGNSMKWVVTILLLGVVGVVLDASNAAWRRSITFPHSSMKDNRYNVRKMTDYHDVCVVGAGLSGAVIAERYASQRNQTCLIIERRNHIGGNCYDYIDEETGIRVSKYGAHLFHTYYDRVWNYVQKFSDWTPFELEVVGHVNDKYVPIPVNIDTVNTLFNLNITNSEEMDEWLESVQEKYPSGPQNSEEMAKARVGDRLYELIFRPYTIKQWAREPKELSPEVTARIPVRNNFDGRYFADPHQALPTNGYTAIFEKMFDNPLISVQLNTDFFNVRSSLNCGKYYYTGPVDRYFADSGLKKLEYRSLDFERRVFKTVGFYQPRGIVNHPGLSDNFTRIVEYKHFLNQTSNYTVVFVEYSKGTGEPYYPVPNPENQDLFAKYKEMCGKEPGVSFVGRLANYKYFNMDQTIENSLALFDEDSASVDLIVNYCNHGDVKKSVADMQSTLEFSNTFVYSSCGKSVQVDGKNVDVQILSKGVDGFMHHMKRKDLRFASRNVFIQATSGISGEVVKSSLAKIGANKVFVDFATLPFANCQLSVCARNMAYNPDSDFVATHEAMKRHVGVVKSVGL